MPISIDYDSNENVIYTKAEGAIKLDDIMEYFSSVTALSLQKGYRVLADYTDVFLDLSTDDLREMARQRKMLSAPNEKIRIAVFCNEDMVFGIGRVYEALVGEDKHEVMIFRSQEDAEKWLGL